MVSQLLIYQRVRLCANLLWFDLAEGYGKAGHGEEGLIALAVRSMGLIDTSGHCWYEASGS